MVFATLALGAFGADQGLLTYFADLSGPGFPLLSVFWRKFCLCYVRSLRARRARSAGIAIAQVQLSWRQ